MPKEEAKSSQTLLLLFIFILIFDLSKITKTAPGSFPDWASYFSGSSGRWVYILVFDLLPIAAIISLVRRQLQSSLAAPPKPQASRPLKDSGPDPLLTLRIFAFVMVFLGHYFLVVFPATSTGPGMLSFGMLASPWAGVWLFFSLSGYLMGKGFFSGRYALDSAGISRFYLNRALRVFPIYVFAVVLVCAFVSREALKPENSWMLIKILCLDYQANLPINPIGALWSISSEFQFYLLSPFIAMAILRLDKKHPLAPLLGLLLAGFFLRYLGLHVFGLSYTESLYTPMVCNLDCFAGGMLLAWILQARRDAPKKDSGRYLPWGLALLGLFYLPFPFLGGPVLSSSYQFHYATVAPSLTCLLALLAIALFERSDLQAAWQKYPWGAKIVRATQAAGALTYCLYCFHEPVLLSMRKLAGESMSLLYSLNFFPVSAALVLFFAYVFYHGIEVPFSNAKRR